MFRNIKNNNTFSLVPLPAGRKAIGSRWVYAVKSNNDEQLRYKARLVAKGFSQVKDIEYSETFSPTVNITSIRIVVQLAVQNNLPIFQMDVSSAYLHANIDCEIFLKLPQGYEVGKSGENLVYLLHKSLYGLKQSGRNWHNLLRSFLFKKGYIQSAVDPSLFIKFVNGLLIIILAWVDDFLIAASSSQFLEIKSHISKVLIFLVIKMV